LEVARVHSSATFAVDIRDGLNVVHSHGEVDLSSRDELRDVLAPLTEGTADLIIDLTGTSFLDSTGLGVLMWAHGRLSEHGRRVTLVVQEHGRVAKVLHVSGADSVLDVVHRSGRETGGVAE
jgi:anti-sigma B factor antagonist